MRKFNKTYFFIFSIYLKTNYLKIFCEKYLYVSCLKEERIKEGF